MVLHCFQSLSHRSASGITVDQSRVGPLCSLMEDYIMFDWPVYSTINGAVLLENLVSRETWRSKHHL